MSFFGNRSNIVSVLHKPHGYRMCYAWVLTFPSRRVKGDGHTLSHVPPCLPAQRWYWQAIAHFSFLCHNEVGAWSAPPGPLSRMLLFLSWIRTLQLSSSPTSQRPSCPTPAEHHYANLNLKWMYVASGFSKFVKKSVLKDTRFVKGDTMYLRVRVDRNGLIPE